MRISRPNFTGHVLGFARLGRPHHELAKYDFTLEFEAPTARRRHVGTDVTLTTLRDVAEFIGALPVRRQRAP